MSRPLEKPQRFYRHLGRLYWTYWTHYHQYYNEYFKEEWHCWEEWGIFFGWRHSNMRWFGFEDHYYDGHTCQLLAFCGLVVGKLYSYDAQPVKPLV